MIPLVPVLLATIAIGVTAALLAWRERPEPGATPLVAMLAGQCWWSAFLVFQLQATSLGAKLLWVNLSWIGVMVIPVAWLLFALEYTGYDKYVQARYVLMLSIVPAVTVGLALTSPYHDLLYVESTLVERGGTLRLEQVGGVWFWVAAGYTYLLGFLGSIPLLNLVRSDAVPFRGQGAALLVGTLVPWASNALFLVGVIPSGIDPTPIAFAISGVAYLGALTRFRLLGTSPSPNRRARRLVFERMHDGAVVVDSHDYVVDINESAAGILGVTPRDAIGSLASEVIPAYETLPADGSGTSPLTVPDQRGSRQYDVTVTRIDDVRGRTVGRVITFHDISEYLRQQQRLKVLNRILRHNIRTETNLIHGYADLLGDEDDERTNIVKQRALRIEEMGRKGREVINLFERARDPNDVVSLRRVLDEAVEAAREANPSVTVERTGDDGSIQVPGAVDPVLENVVENAAEHNPNPDPHVRIDVTRTDDRVRVRVADDGPGIDDYEREVLERGTETPLKHGSGLGLWTIKWGSDIAGGTVEFDQNEPTGSIVTVEVPVAGTVEESGVTEGDRGVEETRP